MKRTLLLVDDEPVNLSLLQAVLAPLGCDFVLAKDGVEALEKLEAHPVDLVLLGLMMPRLDGIETLQRIRAREGAPWVPVVLVTAQHEREARLRGIQAGADEFLEKPIDRALLTARVRTLLRLREAQDELQRRAEALEQLHADRRELMGFIVHDLKNPLSILRLNLGFIRSEQAALKEPEREALEDALSATTRMTGMVLDLLTVERMEQAELTLTKGRVVLDELLAEIARSYRREAAARRVELEVHATPVAFEGDRELLRRLLENLLENGLRHTPAGGRVEIAVETGESLSVYVSNTGAVIPESIRGTLFQKFVRGEGGERSRAGLGLYFCARVAELHEGDLSLIEREGWPVSFRLRLPVRSEVKTAAAAPAVRVLETSVAPRVLVVDDDPSILRAHSRVLESERLTVVGASNAKEALERLSEGRFDAVVSDIAMPETDGLDLLRAIRGVDLDVPVLLVTGQPLLEYATRAIELGAFRFLVKPVGFDQLVREVRTAIAFGRSARARREALSLLDDGPRARGDLASLQVCFDRALEHIWVAVQPIVSWSGRKTVAYEALVRSRDEMLPHPGALLDAAERLGRVLELGRRIRELTAAAFAAAPEDTRLFVNLHTLEVEDEELLKGPLSPLADRVTLELTERAALPPANKLKPVLSQLRNAGYRLALDDLGAGYAGLSSFALLEPEVVKLDMSIVRGVDASPTKRRLVGSMVDLCHALDRSLVAEGVETAEERAALTALGCDTFQGYFFARPGPPFPTPVFD